MEHRFNRHAGPVRGPLPEGRIRAVHLSGDGVAFSHLAQHVASLLARGGNQVGWECAELDAVLKVVERSQRVSVEFLHFGEREIRFRRAGVRDDGLKFGRQRLPDFQRDDAFARAVRLVEAGIIIKRRGAVESERDVGARPDEFRAVDDAGLQAGENFARRRGLRRGAEPAIDFAAEAGSERSLSPRRSVRLATSRRN